jgi:predicted TIM-barrel fold metal-dependent hydrolase
VIIDVHGHITSPELFKKYPMPPSLADIDGMIEQKLRAGIDLTIVGSPVGAGTMTKMPGLDNYAQTSDELKRFHEWLASVVAKHSKHLKAYAYTNPFGDEKLLESTKQTVKEGGFVGLIINTSVRGEYLDSERADAFFAMAAELDVPIFLHPPAEPVGSSSLRDPRMIEQVGRFCDVTTGLAALIFGGRLEQYPNLRFLAAMAGGAISLLAEKLDLAYQPRHWGAKPNQPVVTPVQGRMGGGPSIIPYQNKITQSPSSYIKRIFVDTTSMNASSHLANLQMMGTDHMLFGSDSPPLPFPLEQVVGLVQNLPLTEEEKQKIFYKNAMRLFSFSFSFSFNP